jgi:nucleoside-diphosphate-sugar epimerase
MANLSKVLITGIDGFTGVHLSNLLSEHGFECVGLGCDLRDKESVFSQVSKHKPNYVVHLAGISFAAEANSESIYSVNVTGSLNLLDALKQLRSCPKKVILASSATVYGNIKEAKLDETLCARPLSHYGCSKLSMEHMAQNYFDSLPIIITRPFNYTGPNHSERFLIPKLLDAYKRGLSVVELGNLDVSREFNDVRDVVNIYRLLLTSSFTSDVVNICSGKSISLSVIVKLMNEISGNTMGIKTNPEFSRSNEIKDLSGDSHKLSTLIDSSFRYQIEDTLRWMYNF